MAAASERIWEMVRAFQPSRVILTGIELGIFAQLGDESKTSNDIAKAVNADLRATDRLMNALVGLGLLIKEGNLFRNAPDAGEALVPGKPGYVGGALMHAANLWKNWSTLTDAVRIGTSVISREESLSEDHAKPFIAAMHVFAMEQADEIVSRINLSNVRRMIDIGGGSGAYSIVFCKAKPDLESVIYDLPEVAPLTQGYIEQAGMSDRIKTHIGDFNKDDVPIGFDLAYISQVLHTNSFQENRELLSKVYKSLNNGGQIVIQEFVIDENRTSPASHAMFAINMLVATKAGDTYTESEINDWLTSAGFTDIVRIDPPTNTTLVIARKP